jgi:hypothetical protein
MYRDVLCGKNDQIHLFFLYFRDFFIKNEKNWKKTKQNPEYKLVNFHSYFRFVAFL